ncbi:dipeptidase [Dokdonella sp.]|uniref:dipeptidase n=1 Tax=Dokdonella sp. TaxID=2291710 RepID=UPI003527E408
MLQNRRQFLIGMASMASAPLWLSAQRAMAGSPGNASWPGYARAMVIDALGGPGEYDAEPYSPLSARALDDVRASGLTAVNVTVSGVGSYANDPESTIRNIAYWNAQIAAHPERLMLVREAADLDTAKSTGRLGLIYGFQDTTPIGEDLSRLERYDHLGVRIVQLTYNRRNLVGDGCLEAGNAGLSTLGIELIEKLNQRHLQIDLSHAGERTTLEAIARSKDPVAITHSGCAALAPLPRNKTDNELRKLADSGGVVGIYLMPFLRVKGQPTAQDLIAHIEHAIKVCGEDHVGIGSDGGISPINFNEEFKRKHAEDVADRRARGISAPGEDPEVYIFLPDLNTANRLEHLASLLAARGHSDRLIEKIIGANFARLFRATWASA